MQEVSETRVRQRAVTRGDLVGAGVVAALVVAAFVVPRIAGEEWRRRLYAESAPIYGNWLVHFGWGTGPAIAIAGLVIVYGPGLAERLSWRRLLVVSWATASAWAFALAMVDGWQRGFVDRLADGHEYLYEVPGVTDIHAMLRGFAGRILDFQPDSWTTHVSGHPPGALLFFVLLDRVGLGGSTWAGWVCMLIGCSAVAAVAVALRALGAENRARAALPFLVLAPAVIWIAVSADAMFTGVTAWAVALLAIATGPARESERTRVDGVKATVRRLFALPDRPFVAVAAGVLFGFGVYLNYGLALMAIPALAVLVAGRTVRPLLPALGGALVVALAFTASGFWWFDGYQLVVQRYYQGIASERPYSYWVWANLAAAACTVGLATAAALHRVFSPRLLRARDPAVLLAVAGLCAILLADLSGLSKAETERIWLPFDIWLLVATAFLPRRSVRGWLAVQALGALLINHTIFTNW